MNQENVTVRVFSELWQAQIAQQRLESAGIEAFIPDAHLASQGGFTSAINGVRLQVSSDHANQAITLLDSPAPEPSEEEWNQLNPEDTPADQSPV